MDAGFISGVGNEFILAVTDVAGGSHACAHQEEKCMSFRSERFTTTLTYSDDERAQAAAALYQYNIAQTGIDDRADIGAELRDQSGKTWGGLWGRTELGLLFLDMFFLPEQLRGQSFGSQLLTTIEEEAIRRGCKKAVVETSSFQAPLFYMQHGFEEFGKVEFGIPGHARVFLRKDLL
ncbi:MULTISPECIES: GNAT family N-acetyltransferase [Mesorhizobium]|nr:MULTISPECIES: GNAT family N-acetyltransferase [Mesorhizobium]MCF6121841.1 GNAT family N-acetyltransferase [Mesorhizobium ciceri]MCQ8812422.1 GNAT family N-acetyltransferase [Mesorhizobium sp. SEMIA396]